MIYNLYIIFIKTFYKKHIFRIDIIMFCNVFSKLLEQNEITLVINEKRKKTLQKLYIVLKY